MITPNIDPSKHSLDKETLYSPLYNNAVEVDEAEVLPKVNRYLYGLDARTGVLQTFTNADYRSEALSLSPMWLWKDAHKEDIEYFRTLTTFDDQNKTIIMKLHNYDGKLISYKRRRLGQGKWITAKGTHPNAQPIVRVRLDNKPIYVIEGHHDSLTSVLMGINFIMLPTVNYTQFTEQDVSMMIDREVIFMPDIGDGNKSIDAMLSMRDQVKDITSKTAIINLLTFLSSFNISYTHHKIDLSDLTTCWTHGLTSLKSSLQVYALGEKS